MDLDGLYAEICRDPTIGEEVRVLHAELHSEDRDSFHVPRQVAALLRYFYSPASQGALAGLFAIVYHYDNSFIITLQLFLTVVSVFFVCVLIQLSCFACNSLLRVFSWVRAAGTVTTRRSLRNLRFAYECWLHPGWLMQWAWPWGYRVFTRSWPARCVRWLLLVVWYVLHAVVVFPVGCALRLVCFICLLPFRMCFVLGRAILKVSSLFFEKMS